MSQAVGLYPFRDYSGAVIGFIKAELSKIPLSNVFETIQERLFLLALVLVLSLLGASLFAMNGFLRPLDEVVSKTNLISEKSSPVMSAIVALSVMAQQSTRKLLRR